MQFKLVLKNYFSDLSAQIGNEVIIKVTVYNPKYFLPSLAELKLKFNIPVFGCKFKVTPSKGKELITLFELTVNGCSEPVDASYEFYFYLTKADFDADMMKGISYNS